MQCRNHGVIWKGTWDELRTPPLPPNQKPFYGSVATGTQWMECRKCLTFVKLEGTESENR